MTVYLNISGHGELPGGGFDPGATGFITKGEHKYFEEDLFPAMKKFTPKDAKIVYFSEYNVFRHKNLEALVKKLEKQYNDKVVVIEWHYDAGGAASSGGHVIVYKGFEPDALDLKIRDIIKKHIGVRYNHKGHVGINGRNNLHNLNVAANKGINYRLVELGFGTNKKDAQIMMENVEAIAKDFVELFVGKAVDKPVEVKPVEIPAKNPVAEPVKKPVGKVNYNGNSIVDYLNAAKIDSSPDNRRKLAVEYNVPNYDLSAAKNLELLNAMRDGKKPAPVAKKTIAQLVNETLAGKHGNGDKRKQSLGADYDAVQAVINGKPKAAVTAKKTAVSSEIKVGDKVTASRLYANGAATKLARTNPITGYVERINNSWKNPYRLVKTKGKADYLGFARKSDLKK